jgi:alkylhydroperoxidase family enzyme
LAFIRTIPPAHATSETAEVYRYMAEVGGNEMVARIVQMFSLRAGSMRRMIRGWQLMMWHGSEPRTHRELLAAVVSRINDCHY